MSTQVYSAPNVCCEFLRHNRPTMRSCTAGRMPVLCKCLQVLCSCCVDVPHCGHSLGSRLDALSQAKIEQVVTAERKKGLSLSHPGRSKHSGHPQSDSPEPAPLPDSTLGLRPRQPDGRLSKHEREGNTYLGAEMQARRAGLLLLFLLGIFFRLFLFGWGFFVGGVWLGLGVLFVCCF